MTVILTIHSIAKKYRVSYPDGETGITLLNEHVITNRGPEECVSIAGLSESEIKDSAITRTDFLRVQPILGSVERVRTIIESESEVTNDLSSRLNTTPSPKIKQSVLLTYRGYSGKWSQNIEAIKRDYPWLRKAPPLKLSSPVGIYYLLSNPDTSFQWIKAGIDKKVLCSSERGLMTIKSETTYIIRQLFSMMKFFDGAQSQPSQNDTKIEP